MNITISIEDQFAESARERAAEVGETLEQAIEDYVRTLASSPNRSELLPKHKTLREQTYLIG